MKKIRIYFGLILILILSTNILAQDATKKSSAAETDKAVVKLQQKVLLTSDQAAKVKSIINTYTAGDKTSEDLANAQSKVESLLDEKQKEKYNIIKNDWWKSISKVKREDK